MPLTEFFCVGSIRPAQKLTEKWNEMKILFKTEVLVDRLIKHSLLVGLHPSVLAASLNYIFLRAHETISANTDFPPNLQGHKVNTLISLLDTIRTNHDLNGTKFQNLAWGSVSFDEARTARKRKQSDKPGKTTSRPKRQQPTKKPKSTKPKKRSTPRIFPKIGPESTTRHDSAKGYAYALLTPFGLAVLIAFIFGLTFAFPVFNLHFLFLSSNHGGQHYCRFFIPQLKKIIETRAGKGKLCTSLLIRNAWYFFLRWIPHTLAFALPSYPARTASAQRMITMKIQFAPSVKRHTLHLEFGDTTSSHFNPNTLAKILPFICKLNKTPTKHRTILDWNLPCFQRVFSKILLL